MRNIFRFILFYRITYDPFCSIKIKITTFNELGFIKMHLYKDASLQKTGYKRKTLFGQLFKIERKGSYFVKYDLNWSRYELRVLEILGNSGIFDPINCFVIRPGPEKILGLTQPDSFEISHDFNNQAFDP